MRQHSENAFTTPLGGIARNRRAGGNNARVTQRWGLTLGLLIGALARRTSPSRTGYNSLQCSADGLVLLTRVPQHKTAGAGFRYFRPIAKRFVLPKTFHDRRNSRRYVT